MMAAKIEVAMKKSEPMMWARLDLPPIVVPPKENEKKKEETDSEEDDDEWWTMNDERVETKMYSVYF